jgi:Protein of unknown function (DUF2950)
VLSRWLTSATFRALARLLLVALLAPAPLLAQAPPGGQGPPAFKPEELDQGPQASGGAYAYVANGRMIGGFALIAFPAQYGVSGVTTFMVNHDGMVYQKDLGRRTATLARQINTFDASGAGR